MKKKIVIIGGGPAGLLLANGLLAQNIDTQDMVICEPREAYSRQGVLNKSVFLKVEGFLKIKFEEYGKVRLKDLERKVQKHTLQQNVTIEIAEFVDFAKSADGKKGVWIKYANQEMVLVECDFVMFCTGKSSVFAQKLSERYPDTSFDSSSIFKGLSVRRHLIATLEMSEATQKGFLKYSRFPVIRTSRLSTAEFVRGLEALRQLGWKKFIYPECHSFYLGNNRVRFYTECPDNLNVTQQKEWLACVLATVSNNSALNYKLLNSKKTPNSYKLNPFIVDPQIFNHSFFEKNDIPTCFFVGDAFFSGDYRLGNGLTRVLEQVNLISQSIKNFEPDQYQEKLAIIIKTYEDKLVNFYKKREGDFERWLMLAYKDYQSFLSSLPQDAINPTWQNTLKEIVALRFYYENVAKQDFNYQPLPPRPPFPILRKEKKWLIQMQSYVLQSLRQLPLTCVKEREDSLNKLEKLLFSWQDLGDDWLRRLQYSEAIFAYERAKELYNIFPDAKKDESLFLEIIADLVHSLRKLQENGKINNSKIVINLVTEGLDIISNLLRPYPKKIINIREELFFALVHLVADESSRSNDTFYIPHIEYINKNQKDIILPPRVPKPISQALNKIKELNKNNKIKRENLIFKPLNKKTENVSNNTLEKKSSPSTLRYHG